MTMPVKLEAAPIFSGYQPPRDDEEGLTPMQRHERRESLRRALAVLQAVSPLATLSRGYAVARKKDAPQTIIRSAAQVTPGEALELLLAAGRVECRVEATLPDEEASIGSILKGTA